MSVTPAPKPVQVQARRNRILLVMLSIVFAGVVAGTATALVLGSQTGEWQFFALTADAVFFGFVLGAGFWLVLRGRSRWAVGILIGGMTVSLCILVSLFSGLGTPFALATVFLGIFFSIQTLSRQDVTWGVAASVVGSFMVAMADLLAGQFQLEVAALQTVIAIAVVLIAVVFTNLLLVQFRTYSITSKLLAAFLIVALFPISVLTFLFTVSSRNALTTQANAALLGIAGQSAREIDNFITTNLDTLRSEAQIFLFSTYLNLSPAEREASEQQINSASINGLLGRLLRRDPLNITSYALLDEQGIDVADTVQSEIGKDKSDRDYFRSVIESGLPYASPVEISQETGEPSIFFAAPVRDDAGEIIGVLRVHYKAVVLQQIIFETNRLAGEQSFGILLDENGIQLANGSQPASIFKSVRQFDAQTIADLKAAGRLPDLPDEQLYTALPEFSAGLVDADQQPVFSAELSGAAGGRSVVAVARLTSQPWSVAYSQSESVLYEPITAQARAASIASLVITTMVSGLALVITRQLNRPITSLNLAAQQITAGDLSTQAAVDTSDEIGDLAQAFNSMTAKLRQTLAGLEQRVAERTRAVELSADVSRRLSTILDQAELVRAVVDEVQEAFGYYHAHIYLVDEGHKNLVMAGGTGEAGLTMLGRGHHIPWGQGLVGRAAENNQVVLVPETASEPGWLSNPLLPETKAEVAVPIAIGEQMLGVLDVQHNVVGGLTERDAELLQSIANQVAVAVRNAQLYMQAQNRAERETMAGAIAQHIQTATSVEDVLQIAVRELANALGAQRAGIQLGDQVTDDGRQAQTTGVSDGKI